MMHTLARTVLAALLPAVRAMGVSPLAASRQGLVTRPRRGGTRPAFAAAFLALAAGLIWYGLSSGGALTARLLTLAVGALSFFVAVALAVAYLVSPVVATLGVVVRRLGGEGRLATGNTTRNFVVGASEVVETMNITELRGSSHDIQRALQESKRETQFSDQEWDVADVMEALHPFLHWDVRK